MKEFLTALLERRDLSREQACEAMTKIMTGEATEAQIAGFLIALRMKGETVAEITGCAAAMREAATHVDAGGLDVVDTCGTGGDCKGTFNVSTASAIVAAGAGVPVAKHGNRGVSSGSGSADVLRVLGVNLEVGPEAMGRCIREAGIGFLFAPALHKAMKYAIGPRRELGVRTVFNILGPLTNPAGARRQLLGVFSEPMVEVIGGVLAGLGAVQAMVVHSADGMDELSICDETVVAEVKAGEVSLDRVVPEQVGLQRAPLEDLLVATPEESAALIQGILAGQGGAPRDIVLLNAGAAIYVGGKAATLAEGVALATQSVDSGAAKAALEALVRISQETA